jgi:hypothetical protein
MIAGAADTLTSASMPSSLSVDRWRKTVFLDQETISAKLKKSEIALGCRT